jgi:hypothetical protein
MTTTIPTSHGNLRLDQIVDIVQYNAYAHNRDMGCTHEALVRIGLGDDRYKAIYENEKDINNN